MHTELNRSINQLDRLQPRYESFKRTCLDWVGISPCFLLQHWLNVFIYSERISGLSSPLMLCGVAGVPCLAYSRFVLPRSWQSCSLQLLINVLRVTCLGVWLECSLTRTRRERGGVCPVNFNISPRHNSVRLLKSTRCWFHQLFCPSCLQRVLFV